MAGFHYTKRSGPSLQLKGYRVMKIVICPLAVCLLMASAALNGAEKNLPPSASGNSLTRTYVEAVPAAAEVPAVENPVQAPLEPEKPAAALASVKKAPIAAEIKMPSINYRPPVMTANETPPDNLHLDEVMDALTPICGLPAAIERVLNCFVMQLQNEKLVLVAKNSDGECGIDRVSLFFDLYDTVDIPAARRLIVPIVSGLLQDFNGQEKLRGYFNTFPLTYEQVVIQIRVRSKRCGFVYPVLGNITFIAAMDGTVTYGTLNSFTYEVDSLRTETYRQALQLSGL